MRHFILLAVGLILAGLAVTGCRGGKDQPTQQSENLGSTSAGDLLERFRKISNQEEQAEFFKNLSPADQQALTQAMKNFPIIFELDPPIAQPGDKVEIYGMNLDRDRDKIRVAFRGEDGTKYGEIKELDEFEVVFLVPYDVPGGALIVEVQKKDDSGKWISSMNTAPFWTPAAPDQTATLKIGPTELKPTGEAVGYFRNYGGAERYFLEMEQGLLTVSAESIRLEGHRIIDRTDGYPDTRLALRSGSGAGIIFTDDRSPEDLNALLDKVPLPKGKYYIEVEGAPNDKHEDGEQQRGWYRLRTRVDYAPYLREVSPALGPGGSEVTVRADNLDPEAGNNKVELVTERPFLHFWTREVSLPVEIEQMKVLEGGSRQADSYELHLRIPEDLRAQPGGYRIRISHERGSSDSYPESADWRFHYCEKGEQDFMACLGKPFNFKLTREEKIIAGHTHAQKPTLVFDAFASQSVEMRLQAVNPDLTLRKELPEVKVYPPRSDTPLDFADLQELDLGQRRLVLDNLPVSGEYSVVVGPSESGAAGLFWLSLRDITEEAPEHTIRAVSGNGLVVRDGPAPGEPLVVLVTRAGKPWIGVPVIFQGPCTSAVISTGLDGQAYWYDFPKPPRGMMATATARLRGSSKEAVFTYMMADINPPHDWDWDGDGLSEPMEMVLDTDPDNPDSDHDGVPDGRQYYEQIRSDPELREEALRIEKQYRDFSKTCPRPNFTSPRDHRHAPAAVPFRHR